MDAVDRDFMLPGITRALGGAAPLASQAWRIKTLLERLVPGPDTRIDALKRLFGMYAYAGAAAVSDELLAQARAEWAVVGDIVHRVTRRSDALPQRPSL